MPVLAYAKGNDNSLAFSFNKWNFFINIKQIISPERLFLPLKQNKNRHWSASLTAEAAMTLPLFFYTSFILWQCFLLLLLQLSVCKEVTTVALTAGSLGYTERTSEEKIGVLIYKPLLWSVLQEQERMEHLQITLEEEDICIQATIEYDFLCEALLFPVIRIPVKQTFCFIPYYGESAEDCYAEEAASSADVVYVTTTGTVYHESKSCVYLTVRVSAVGYAQIGTKRNASGRKYTACSRCMESEVPEQVYISAGGERFHQRADCPALKRVVQEKRREEVTLPACSKCGKEKE